MLMLMGIAMMRWRMADLISELLRSGPCHLSDHKNWRVVVIVFVLFSSLLRGLMAFSFGVHT
jgi:hypothetical protein